MKPNESVERIAADARCLQFPPLSSAAIAHFFRWAAAYSATLKTIVAVSHICLAVFLVGCACQERSARSRSSTPQASTNLQFVLWFYTNLYFASGGTVTITKKENETCIYVTGEVNHPDRIPWTNGLTLTKAIELAGGFTDFASKARVMLRRANGSTEQYSFVRPVADTVKNAKLEAGDMVHVTSRAWLWP